MLADRWKYERKLLNSSFSLSVLQSYVPIFTKCIAKSIEHLKANCDKGEFDIKHDVTVVVMNAVMSKNVYTYSRRDRFKCTDLGSLLLNFVRN